MKIFNNNGILNIKSFLLFLVLFSLFSSSFFYAVKNFKALDSFNTFNAGQVSSITTSNDKEVTIKTSNGWIIKLEPNKQFNTASERVEIRNYRYRKAGLKTCFIENNNENCLNTYHASKKGIKDMSDIHPSFQF